MNGRNRRPLARPALIAVAASSALLLTACGGGGNGNTGTASGGGNGTGGQAQAAPSSSGDVLASPRNYVGRQVTVSGLVDQVLGPHAFTVREARHGVGNSGTDVVGGSGGNNGGQVGGVMGDVGGGSGTPTGNGTPSGSSGTAAGGTGTSGGNNGGQGGGVMGDVGGSGGTPGSGKEHGGKALLVLSKASVTLRQNSAVRVSGTVAPNFSPQAARGFLGEPTSPAIGNFTGQPFMQADNVRNGPGGGTGNGENSDGGG
jgi:hypothetical protein